MLILNWEHFFKPEIRSSGRALLKNGKLSISQPSDTEIIVYIRNLKVSLKTKSVESKTIIADCACSVGNKGQFCKHIWAALLTTEKNNSDFFENKNEIEKKLKSIKTKHDVFKEKQSGYRKEQYQKQKQRMKDFKKLKKGRLNKPELPHEVETALVFFTQNGFDLKASLSKETIGAAKKRLTRIFHPDIGGTHEEILQLNNFSEILMRFINRQ